MPPEPNFDDPAVEEAWCNDQREQVEWYLDQQPIDRGRIGEWPAFHLPPFISVWAIESGVVENAMGWWVISGNLPTDYFSATGLDHPRLVLNAAADRWDTMLKDFEAGRPAGTVSITGLETNPELRELLKTRVMLLRKTADDEDFWKSFDEDMDE